MQIVENQRWPDITPNIGCIAGTGCSPAIGSCIAVFPGVSEESEICEVTRVYLLDRPFEDVSI